MNFDTPPLGPGAQSKRIWLEIRYAPFGAGAQSRRIWLEFRYALFKGRGPVNEDMA